MTNIRHYQSLKDTREALTRVKDGLAEQLPTDLLTQDIREAINFMMNNEFKEIEDIEVYNYEATRKNLDSLLAKYRSYKSKKATIEERRL